jgi:hypothetical protein
MKPTSSKNSSSANSNFNIPSTIKLIITIASSVTILFIIGVYIYLIFRNPKYLDPQKFGLPTLLIFAFSVLLVVNLPWEKLGLRIKKIGMIELEEKIEVQAKDVSQEIAELQIKIDELEEKVLPIDNSVKTKLSEIICKFLSKYDAWAFSASRIKTWGAQQKGFESLHNYTLSEIKTELRRLLAKGIVATRTSAKGNTLYKLNNKDFG